MKVLRITAVAAFTSLLISSTASADVTLSIQDGRVSIVAKDATLRQILAEWARVGQTKVVNIERIPGGPQTIELTNVPESEALDTLLRSVSGFIAAPRTTPAGAHTSQFDRIVVMPTTAAPRAPVAAAAAPASQPPFQTQQMPQVVDDDVDDERPAPPVAMPPGAQRGPIFNQFPTPQMVNPATGQPMPQTGAAQPFNPNQPQLVQPNQAPPPQQPTSVPTAPFGGVAVPGMVAPAPAQPGVITPGQPQPPGQPRRPGGGNDIEGA